MSRTTAFMLAALGRPRRVGAILPSSLPLADAMARAAAGAQGLIELGAGTGAITAALCRLHPDVPTLAVEIDPALARHLQRRFPRVEVRSDSAHHVLSELPELPQATVLVSSLPFRSLPPRLRLRSSLAVEKFLMSRPACRLVQYTYLPLQPFPLRHDEALCWRRIEPVWRNAPPAWVWELQARAGRGPAP